jgi:hypothetical protein
METLGYSAVVELRLMLNGESIDVAKTGPDRITLVEPRELPAGPAELIITIDGRDTIHPVVLQASSAASRIVSYW